MRILLRCCLLLAVVLNIQAAVLECDFSSGGCVPVSITDVTTENEAITINGKPVDFQDQNTNSLHFANPAKLNYVPTGVFKIFPQLSAFSIMNGSLTNLVTNAFIDCGMLMTINLNQNNFETIPASFAPTCINVTTLNMMQNNIKNIDIDAFKGLTFLNYLMLRDNQISCIPPGVFRHTTVLQNIDLYGNQITKLDPLTFKGIPNLNSIMLGSNQIVSIPAFDFRLTAMTSGFYIMLENNPIMAISPQFLTKLFVSRLGYTSSTHVNFYDSYGNLTTCIPKNNMYTSSINTYSWPMSNVSLTPCYNNWNPEIENLPVSCAPAVTTTSTTSTVTTTPTYPISTPPGGNEPGDGPHQWLGNKNFFAIISNAMKNFTANVQFF